MMMMVNIQPSFDIPRSGEVADMLDKCLLWYERQQESAPTSALLLEKIRDLAASICKLEANDITTQYQ